MQITETHQARHEDRDKIIMVRCGASEHGDFNISGEKQAF